jgi:hypothetical protein
VKTEKQSLYILRFKDEGVIKVGLAGDPWLRIAALSTARFDLGASYLVQCRNQATVRTLERMLKTFFAEHQVMPGEKLSSGNTETFRALILPEMLQAIEKLSSTFPGSELKILPDLSSLVPAQAEKRKGLSRAECLARSKARHLEEAKCELLENEQRLEETAAILPKLSVQSIEIREDTPEKFRCQIELHKGQIALGLQLFRAPGGMRINGLLWGVDGVSYSEEKDTCDFSLWFDLKHHAQCRDESLIPNDIAERALALWRNFVAEWQAGAGSQRPIGDHSPEPEFTSLTDVHKSCT